MHSARAAVAAAILYLLASLASAPAAFAGTTGLVRGTITEAGKPVAGAAVTLVGEGSTFRTTTRSDGTFAFEHVPFGTYALSAASGSATSNRNISVASDAVVVVSLDLAVLQTIARTKSGLVKTASSLPVSVNVLDKRQIQAIPDNQSLDKLITTLPGIVSFSYNEPVAHGFHGLTYEIDGVPIPLGTAANFSEVIDPRSIDSLEVFTGAFPAEYGGTRQGAVVDIISHRPNDPSAPAAGSFGTGLSNYGGAQTSLDESLGIGKSTRAFLNLNEERTNRGIDSPTFDPVHDRSNQSNQFLRTITNVGSLDTLAFDLSNNVASFQIPINTTFNPNDPVISPPGTDDVQREYDSFADAVFTINAKSGNAFTEIAPFYRYDRIRYLGDLPNDLDSYLLNPGAPATFLDGLQQDRHSTFYGLNLTQFAVYGPHAIKAGIQTQVENFTGSELIAFHDPNTGEVNDFADASAQRGSNLGAYIEDKWTPTRYVSVQGGVRFDRSTGYVDGGQISPRLEINGQVDPQDILHAYYGRLYAAPFLEDTRRAAVILNGGSNSNLPVYDLQPERDSYYEIGLAHTFSPGATAYIDFWKRNVQNVLDTTQLAETPLFAVFNNTIGIAKGVDGRVTTTWRNGDSLSFSATLSNSQAGGVNGGTFLFCPPGSSADCSASNLDVTLNPEDHDQAFASNLLYTKRLGRDRSFFASIQPDYGTGFPVQFQNGAGRLPPHLVWNASVGRDARQGNRHGLGYVATFSNFTNNLYLIKINNGFNTTQWGRGFSAGFRVTAQL
ncbi:MAG: TonB-dependent receptor [Vulcanimicrobiaceae bacterium]